MSSLWQRSLLCIAAVLVYILVTASCVADDEHDMASPCNEGACELDCQRNGSPGTCVDNACRCDNDSSPTSSAKPSGFGCSCDSECQGTAQNPGICVHGVCMTAATQACSGEGSSAECPTGSRCWAVEGMDKGVCWPDCEGRLCVGECDDDGSCIPGAGSGCDSSCGTLCGGATGGGGGTGTTNLIGTQCTSDATCGTGAVCYPETYQNKATGFVAGYCMIFNCTETSCPSGSRCVSVGSSSDPTAVCLDECSAEADCRSGYTCSSNSQICWPGCAADVDCPGGYVCQEEICVDADTLCSGSNPTGACPSGQVCRSGVCEVFNCTADAHEPNNSLGVARGGASGTMDDLTICAGDNDYWEISVPAGQLTTVVLNHDLAQGDLDLVSYSSGAVIDSRWGSYYPYSSRGGETGEEAVTFYNQSGTDDTYVVRVVGANSSATAPYSLRIYNTPYTDGPTCGAPTYTSAECEGRGSGGSGLIGFPIPDPQDDFVGAGYMFDSLSNYRWLRRETVMLVRNALHETFAHFPDTLPLGLLDMCQHNGVTPGYDVGDPRHPETTHDQGGNIDIAYFQTGADNHGRIICGPNEGNNDGYFCTAAATTQHIVDLPRQVYFMAQLMKSSRVRVIGADRVIAPLLQAEAQRQRDAGDIDAAQLSAFTRKLAFGDGWPFHHHHIHVSLQWW